MIFYLSPSKQLIYLFSMLYLSMLGGVYFNNLHFSIRLLFALVLIYNWRYTINMYALRNTKKSTIRICFQDETLYLEDQAGNCYYGKLGSFCYVSKFLIILHIKITKNKQDKFVLITQDSLPEPQFRRLSMWARH